MEKVREVRLREKRSEKGMAIRGGAIGGVTRACSGGSGIGEETGDGAARVDEGIASIGETKSGGEDKETYETQETRSTEQDRELLSQHIADSVFHSKVEDMLAKIEKRRKILP